MSDIFSCKNGSKLAPFFLRIRGAFKTGFSCEFYHFVFMFARFDSYSDSKISLRRAAHKSLLKRSYSTRTVLASVPPFWERFGTLSCGEHCPQFLFRQQVTEIQLLTGKDFWLGNHN